MVYMDEAVKAPELPKTTKTLRAYPPLVCLTPDGKEESCEKRVKWAEQDSKDKLQCILDLGITKCMEVEALKGTEKGPRLQGWCVVDPTLAMCREGKQ